MRIWFDTEFIEDGRTIDLISIGMVREDGKTLYIENATCDLSRASPWVEANVIPHLGEGGYLLHRAVMHDVIRVFAGSDPEFWAWYGAYDWVALCQIFGTMMNLPKGWPKYCRDLKQLADSLGDPELPEQTTPKHHALNDAAWTRDAHLWLEQTSVEQLIIKGRLKTVPSTSIV